MTNYYKKKYLKYKKKYIKLCSVMKGGSTNNQIELVNLTNLNTKENPTINNNNFEALKKIYGFWTVESSPEEIQKIVNKNKININLNQPIIKGRYRIILYSNREKIFYGVVGANDWTTIAGLISDIQKLFSMLLPVGLVPEIDKLLESQLFTGRESIAWKDHSGHIYIDCIYKINKQNLDFFELGLGS